MARRGRPPKGKIIDDLDPSLRAEVEEAILSAAGESASAIFRRFGLSSRDLRLDTFIRHASHLRRQREGELLAGKLLAAPDHLSDPELIARLKRMVLIDAVGRLQAGDTKLYETMSLLSRIQDFDRIEIERSAGQRSAEIHEAKIMEMRARQAEAIDAIEAPGLTPELLAQIKSKVLGI
jgi:hypothetical protein